MDGWTDGWTGGRQDTLVSSPLPSRAHHPTHRMSDDDDDDDDDIINKRRRRRWRHVMTPSTIASCQARPAQAKPSPQIMAKVENPMSPSQRPTAMPCHATT